MSGRQSNQPRVFQHPEGLWEPQGTKLVKGGCEQVESLHFTRFRYAGIFPPLPAGDSSACGGGCQPLRRAARTIRSMTTRDPRCWRFSSRKVSAASTSATRLAGTEISRCPLFPFSDRRVTFIIASFGLTLYIHYSTYFL